MKLFSSNSSASASSPPPTFIGLVFALSGWALNANALFSLHVGIQGHLIPAAMALYLVSSSVRRMKPSQRLSCGEPDFPADRLRSSVIARAGSLLFLLMAGAFVGTLILGESVTLLGVAAMALTSAPWSRIPICRERTAVASIVMCAGIGLPLLALRHRPDPIFFLMSGWVFWLCATVAILYRIAGLRRIERDIKAAVRAASTQPA